LLEKKETTQVGPYAQEHVVDDFRVSRRNLSSHRFRDRCGGFKTANDAETLLLRALDASADALFVTQSKSQLHL